MPQDADALADFFDSSTDTFAGDYANCAFVIGIMRMSLLCGGRSPAACRVRDLIAMHVRTRRAAASPRAVAPRATFR